MVMLIWLTMLAFFYLWITKLIRLLEGKIEKAEITLRGMRRKEETCLTI